MEARRQDMMTSVGLLILRVGIGGYLMTHGWRKLTQVLSGDFSFGDHIGLGPTASLLLVTFAEFFCALLVVLGLATRFAAVPAAFAMAVAVFVAHAADPWTAAEAGRLFQAGEMPFPRSKQPAAMFLIAFLALVFTGAGRFSLDALIGPVLRGRRQQPRRGEEA